MANTTHVSQAITLVAADAAADLLGNGAEGALNRAETPLGVRVLRLLDQAADGIAVTATKPMARPKPVDDQHWPIATDLTL